VKRHLAGNLKVLVLLALALAGCGPREVRFSGRVMGTWYTARVVDAPAGVDQNKLADEVRELLQAIDRRLSTYRDDSEVTLFNKNTATDWVAASAALAEVVAEALEVSRLSDGAFDITVAPAVNLWGFGPGGPDRRVPDDRSVEQAHDRIGYQFLQVRDRPPALRKQRPDLAIDLSALAKGYAVDRVAALLAARDIANFMVEVGGEMITRGDNVHGRPWRVAVERPRDSERQIYAVLALSGQAIATSGDYRNFFQVAGKRYSHTIDPRTGRPVTHQLASVSVIDASAMRADAMATALLVLGPEAGWPGTWTWRPCSWFAAATESCKRTPTGSARS